MNMRVTGSLLHCLMPNPRVLNALAVLALLFSGAIRAAELPAFEAIRNNNLSELRSLIEQDPAEATRRSEEGLSPLLFAAYREQPAMVDYLRGKVADLDFFEACVVGDLSTLRRFLARGVDVNQRAVDGFTPLGLSVFFRQPAAAKLLIDAGADLDAKASNSLQVGPIHAAVARSDLSTLSLLLESGADPNLTQQRLMRPLHEASAAGSLPAVAMLLMFGADPLARNEEGKLASDFAREAGHDRLAQRLIDLETKLATP